jgi:hypothetical protein
MDMLVPVTSYVKRRAGTVSSASLVWDRAGLASQKPIRGKSAAQNAGLRYEAKVLGRLNLEWETFLPQVPFRFTSDFVSELCILDGIIFRPPARELILVEVKSRHTADAWFQLRYLYHPVVSVAFPGWGIRLLEICKSYEPGVQLPEPYALHRSIGEFIEKGAAFGVVCWRRV